MTPFLEALSDHAGLCLFHQNNVPAHTAKHLRRYLQIWQSHT